MEYLRRLVRSGMDVEFETSDVRKSSKDLEFAIRAEGYAYARMRDGSYLVNGKNKIVCSLSR